MTDPEQEQRGRGLGFLLLLASIVCCTLSQYLLKRAMVDIGPLPAFSELALWSFVVEHQRALWVVVLGLGLYGCGTVLWLLCLTRLELSFAYPVSTIQYLLVFLAAWLFLGEHIGVARWLGMVVIVAGVLVMSTEKTADA